MIPNATYPKVVSTTFHRYPYTLPSGERPNGIKLRTSQSKAPVSASNPRRLEIPTPFFGVTHNSHLAPVEDSGRNSLVQSPRKCVLSVIDHVRHSGIFILPIPVLVLAQLESHRLGMQDLQPRDATASRIAHRKIGVEQTMYGNMEDQGTQVLAARQALMGSRIFRNRPFYWR